MALFKVNKANLALARAAIRAYGEAYLHGCGNVYATEEDSNFRRDFSNPQSDKSESPSTYRLHFTDVSQVPTTVEDTERQFFASKQRDQREKQRTKTVSKVRTVVVTDEDGSQDEDEELDVKSLPIAQPRKPLQKAVTNGKGPKDKKLVEVDDKDESKDTDPPAAANKKNGAKTDGSAGVVI